MVEFTGFEKSGMLILLMRLGQYDGEPTQNSKRVISKFCQLHQITQEEFGRILNIDTPKEVQFYCNEVFLMDNNKKNIFNLSLYEMLMANGQPNKDKENYFIELTKQCGLPLKLEDLKIYYKL